MLRRLSRKNVGFAVTGLAAGVVLSLTLGSVESRSRAYKELVQTGRFGDLRIVTTALDGNEAKESMIILKGDIPIIHFYRNDSNQVDRFALTNGAHGTVALARLIASGISEFVLHGNEVHDGLRMPVFTMDASDEPGVWHKVMYTPSVVGVYDKDKLVSYRVVGEVYYDIDFDGQFDTKSVYDRESNVVSESIFIEGKWVELAHRDADGQRRRLGRCETEDLRAYTIEGEKKVYFDFVWGKGWHERSQAKTRDGKDGTKP